MKVHQPKGIAPSAFNREEEKELEGELTMEEKYLADLKKNELFQEVVVRGILEKALEEASDVMNIPVVEAEKLQAALLAKQENVQFIKDIIGKLKD